MIVKLAIEKGKTPLQQSFKIKKYKKHMFKSSDNEGTLNICGDILRENVVDCRVQKRHLNYVSKLLFVQMPERKKDATITCCHDKVKFQMLPMFLSNEVL